VVAFDARGRAGEPLYHTNVMMAVGEGFSVVCAEAIPDAAARAAVLRELRDCGHEPVVIGAAAMHGFAGNLLALRSRDGSQLIAMSDAAWASLPPDARSALERHGRIVTAPIPVIERHGGGSVRCMIAEVFLPRGSG
jgi:hypothetical protein